MQEKKNTYLYEQYAEIKNKTINHYTNHEKTIIHSIGLFAFTRNGQR